MAIPVQLLEPDFQKYFLPHLSVAKRGFVSTIPLCKIFNYILYLLYTGCQWKSLPIEKDKDDPEKKEISYQAVYHHYRKWSRDRSLKKIFESGIGTIKDGLNLSEINLDGTHTIAKKGGESVKYQGRKKAKTSNILPIVEQQGYIIATTEIVAGNHHDSFELKENLQQVFGDMKSLELDFKDVIFNADAAFDSNDARKVCWNYNVIPNIDENKRNRKKTKRGRKRHFNKEIYKNRFCIERTFAWVDKFKRLLIRFERIDDYFLGFHFIAFTLINLRDILKV